MKTTKKLKAKPTRWYRWDHVILDGTREVTVLRLSAFRKNGKALIEDIEYQYGRERLLGGSYFVQSNAGFAAKAEKRSIFRDRYIVAFEERVYELRSTSFFKGTYGLFEKEKEVGTITREGFFSTTTFLRLPEDVPIHVMIFLFWLVLQSRQRRSRSA